MGGRHTEKREFLTCFSCITLLDPPLVSLRLGSTLSDDIKEGDDVYFECQATANPPWRKLYWLHGVSTPFISFHAPIQSAKQQSGRVSLNEKEKRELQKNAVGKHFALCVLELTQHTHTHTRNEPKQLEKK